MPPRLAKGTQDQAKDGLRQIAIRFDDETFAKIATKAAEQKMAFAQFVRLMVQRGMNEPEHM